MTIEEFIGKIAVQAVAEFANSEWYIQYSDVESSISLHVAAGGGMQPTQGYMWTIAFIEHASIEDADRMIGIGIKSIAGRTSIPGPTYTGGYD